MQSGGICFSKCLHLVAFCDKIKVRSTYNKTCEEKKMKKIGKVILCVVLALAFFGAGFGAFLHWRSSNWPSKAIKMDMHTEFSAPQNLPAGNGKRVKVVLLMGQSNATGIGRIQYLKDNTTPEQFAKYEAGFDSVKINYCVDNHTNCSNGEFVNVDLGCSVWDDVFGPEVGMAERFSEVWGDEEVIILKYTYSGTSLYYQWLAYGERGSIYKAMKEYVDTYMTALCDAGYDARIGAVCWMQGESDSFEEHVYARYYQAQSNFVSYLRRDFAKYAEDDGICFIDAGISDSPCWPGYQTVNAAKEQMANDSDLNYYFSTIDAGLTYGIEPLDNPDLAHYGAMSTLKLGHLFGDYVIEAYRQHNAK